MDPTVVAGIVASRMENIFLQLRANFKYTFLFFVALTVLYLEGFLVL